MDNITTPITEIRGINARDKNGGFIVYINGRVLSPKRSQKIINHSPDGFSWGYVGSGPAQLALAILLEFTEEYHAQRLFQKFTWDIIANLPINFLLSGQEVIDWLKKEGVEI